MSAVLNFFGCITLIFLLTTTAWSAPTTVELCATALDGVEAVTVEEAEPINVRLHLKVYPRADVNVREVIERRAQQLLRGSPSELRSKFGIAFPTAAETERALIITNFGPATFDFLHDVLTEIDARTSAQILIEVRKPADQAVYALVHILAGLEAGFEAHHFIQKRQRFLFGLRMCVSQEKFLLGLGSTGDCGKHVLGWDMDRYDPVAKIFHHERVYQISIPVRSALSETRFVPYFAEFLKKLIVAIRTKDSRLLETFKNKKFPKLAAIEKVLDLPSSESSFEKISDSRHSDIFWQDNQLYFPPPIGRHYHHLTPLFYGQVVVSLVLVGFSFLSVEERLEFLGSKSLEFGFSHPFC